MNTFSLIYVILTLLLLLSLLVGIYESNKDNADASIITFGMFLGFCISCIVIFVITIYKKPISPIEVYRGNTELQITYQGSIPIDSVVVYKNK